MLGGARPSRMVTVASQLPGANRLLRATRFCSHPSLPGRAELFGGIVAGPTEAVDTLVDEIADLESTMRTCCTCSDDDGDSEEEKAVQAAPPGTARRPLRPAEGVRVRSSGLRVSLSVSECR